MKRQYPTSAHHKMIVVNTDKSKKTSINSAFCVLHSALLFPSFAVTTSQRQTSDLAATAKSLAGELQTLYVERNERPLETLLTALELDGLIVVSAKGLSFVSGQGEFFFHPGLAGLRINELRNGKADQMTEAMSVCPGDKVLDCTLGLGTDAIVAGYAVGSAGQVVGLENSPVIAYLVKAGLISYPIINEDLSAAMQRVQVVQSEHRAYLRALPPDSFDIVYFDPMFRCPRRRSPAINALRGLADPAPLERETIDLAVKIAKKRVVLKERRGSAEFGRLGFEKMHGGRYAPVVYGIIDCQGL